VLDPAWRIDVQPDVQEGLARAQQLELLARLQIPHPGDIHLLGLLSSNRCTLTCTSPARTRCVCSSSSMMLARLRRCSSAALSSNALVSGRNLIKMGFSSWFMLLRYPPDIGCQALAFPIATPLTIKKYLMTVALLQPQACF
jgi:hypothetical protein